MRILALIPARGGSKRLPGKNVRPLGGRPLIQWSIDTAKEIPEISDILVSTDDPLIADIACSAGALVPWLRPADLASDTAGSAGVAIHALDWYEREHGVVDGLLLLQPTSPFRSHESMLRGLELFRSHQDGLVIGVSPAESHPAWCFQIDGQKMTPFIDQGGMHLRSQDLPPAYVINGAFYLINPEYLRSQQRLFGTGMLPLVMDQPQEAIDIDTEWDWNIAEAALVRLIPSFQNM